MFCPCSPLLLVCSAHGWPVFLSSPCLSLHLLLSSLPTSVHPSSLRSFIPLSPLVAFFPSLCYPLPCSPFSLTVKHSSFSLFLSSLSHALPDPSPPPLPSPPSPGSSMSAAATPVAPSPPWSNASGRRGRRCSSWWTRRQPCRAPWTHSRASWRRSRSRSKVRLAVKGIEDVLG